MIQFRFSLQFFSVMYPDFSWQKVDNADGTQDIIGTDMKKLAAGQESVFVRVRDVNHTKHDGKWTYDIWKNPKTYEKNWIISDYVSDVEPYMTMEGYFGVWTQNAIDFLAGKDWGEKPAVVAIVGESGSGKTSLSLELEKRYGIPSLVSYTTRPMRDGETDGREHWFVSEKEMPDRSEMLAYTYFGGNHYWTSLSDLFVTNRMMVTYVIDEGGVLDLYELKKKRTIDVIYVYVSRENNDTDKERKDRDTCREEAQKKMKELGIQPHIYIINDYPDADSFLETEVDNLGKTLEFIAGGCGEDDEEDDED